MVNFRYHLVSLTAVFLALAIGIAVGASVVDRATVDQLERRLDDVRQRADSTNRRNDELSAELDRWRGFANEAGDRLTEGRLEGVRLLLVAVKGTNRDTVERLRSAAVASGGLVEGTLWFTDKLRLTDRADAVRLGAILDDRAGRPDAIRRALVTALATTWSNPGAGSLLQSLRDAAFIEFESIDASPVDLGTLPSEQSLILVASSTEADVPNDQLAVPLVAELAGQQVRRVLVAVEPTAAPAPKTGAAPAAFAAALRRDGAVAGRISTVDNVEDYRGRLAAVLALAALAEGRTGHFGIGPGASRLLPEPPR